ncbi:ABC transporter permease [Nakamurella sp. A5-74]|uniref:ABC transporter permease n=1 Tax=Nakamurella sp. A5-74 TaxID=3158264 RepID=A0AAU8DK00_9ACTN
MRAFTSLSRAMFKGFVRDRTSLFFTLFFPLFFIIIFGTIFGSSGASKQKVELVGDVSLIRTLPAEARAQLDQVLEISPATDLAASLDQVRQGDIAATVEQQGDRLVVHFSAADQVTSGTVLGVLGSFVDSANVTVTGQQPRYSLSAETVEDASLKAIQYVTPGMIGYGIAIGAAFGAAMTLITWRTNKLLRRLRLAPVSTGAVVGSRVVVSLAIALFQLAVFIGVASLPFLGLKLTGSWWMAIPLTLTGTLSFLAIGLFVGAVAKTAEGGAALTNLITLPMAFLSGAFIPLDQAPGWIQGVSKVLPMGWLVQGLKDVMVRGQGPGAAVVPMLVLLGFTVVVGLIATRFFQWDKA